MKTRSLRKPVAPIILGLAGILWLAGCYGPSAVDLDYGNSVRNNLAQTILDPAAGLKNAPATGLSPASGMFEKEQYEKAFKGEEKKPMEMKITY